MEFNNKLNIGDKVKCVYLTNFVIGNIVAIYSILNLTCDQIEYFEYDILFVNKFGCNQVARLSEKRISLCD